MKKTFLVLALMSATLSYAGNYLAFIYNKKPINYNVEVLSPEGGIEGGGEEGGEGSITPNTIASIKCTWGECIGSYTSGQGFYIDGMSDPSNQIPEIGFDNVTRSFAKSNYLFLENNGELYGKGANSDGTIGVNSTEMEITSLTKAVGLSGSIIDVVPDRATIVHTTNGLYFSGYNWVFNDTPISQSKPLRSREIQFSPFVSSSTITDVAFEYNENVLMYADNGKLFVLGSNLNGRFGFGDGQIGTDFTDYTEVPSLTNVKEAFISTDRAYTAILKDGTIWVAGNNPPGLSTMEENLATYTDTGFAASELNMFDYNSTTYLIANNKLYYSGFNPVGRTFSQEFALFPEASAYNIKELVKKNELTLLTTDGKLLAFVWDYSTNEFKFEEVPNPEFVG